MARYCSKCERKFGFFEEDFGGMCRDCYDKLLEEERERRIRKAKEEEEKRKKQIQEENEKRRRLEEQEKKRIEEEQQRKIKEEEQRKKFQEEQNKNNSEKYKSFKSEYMNSSQTMQLYVNMVDCIKERFFYNIFQNEKEHQNYVADGLNLFIKNTIYKLPKGFKLKDLEEVNTTQILLEIIAENGDILKIGNLIDEKEYGSFKRLRQEASEDKQEVVYDFQDNLCFANSNNLENNVYESKERFDADEHRYQKWMYDFPGDAGAIYRDYYAMKCILFSYKYLFYWSLIFIYNAVFFSYKDIFEKSELNTIYNKLQESTQDIIYITNKLYELYSNLYKEDFDIELSKSHIIELTYLKLRNNSPEIITLNESITSVKKEQKLKEVDINNKDKFYKFCKDIIKDERVSNSINNLLTIEEISIDYIIFDILQALLNESGFEWNIEEREYENLIDYRDTLIKVIQEMKNDKSKSEAEKERDRILNGDFSKEIEMQKQEVEYSNVKNGYEFEEYVENLYKKLGYEIEEVTKKSGDQGADVIAYKDDEKYVIQVKFYNSSVGNKAVQEVVGAIGMYNADKGIVVTNSNFTRQAIELAKANNIELVDGERIEQYKKEVIKNITNYDENVSEEYINTIVNKWNELLVQNNVTRIDETNMDKCFELLVKCYIEINEEEEDIFEDYKIETFVRGFSKYTSLGDDILIQDRDDRDIIETYLRKAIYKEDFLTNIYFLLQDNTITKEELKKRIYYEYFLDNMEDITITYRLLVLCDILNETSEKVVNEIQDYREMFEKEGANYLISKSEEVLDRARRAMEEIGGNFEDYNLDNDYDDILDYNNDFEEDNTFNFLDNDDYNDIFDE